MQRLILIVGGTKLALFIASRMILAHWHWSGLEWQSDLLRSVGCEKMRSPLAPRYL